jgi:FAD/FMN-containing dehydrogenase
VPAVLPALAAAVGPSNVLTEPADLTPFLTDWRGRYTGAALAVVRPGSTTETAAVVRIAREHGVCVVPQGGNTGMCAGATPMAAPREAIVVRLDRMSRIRGISPLGDSISVDAGCVLANVQAAAEAADRLFPLSLGAEGSCQVGGNVSTNAGGTAALRYGTMRDLTLGLEAVLPDGRVLDLMTALRKDSAGYDIRHWFIGAEGTLAIVTGAVLKLFPRPRRRATALATCSSIESLLSLLSLAREKVGERLGAFEAMNREQIAIIAEHAPEVAIPFSLDAPWYALVEIADVAGDADPGAALEALLAEALEKGLLPDALLASSEAQAKAFWRIRHSVSEASKAAGYVVSHDSVVPLSGQGRSAKAAEEAIRRARPDARIAIHGHVGDGNLHVLAIVPRLADRERQFAEADAIHAVVDRATMECGGSISAEHGIGHANVKRLARAAPPLEIEMMRALKRMLDPDDLFNPGKLFTV